MKIGIVGSRTFTDFDLMLQEVDITNATEIVSGGARGADTLANQLADRYGLPMTVFLPDYATHGRKAPFVRNTLIVEHSDVIIAFWDSKSTGTLDTINKARKMGKPVKVIEYTRVGLEF